MPSAVLPPGRLGTLSLACIGLFGGAAAPALAALVANSAGSASGLAGPSSATSATQLVSACGPRAMAPPHLSPAHPPVHLAPVHLAPAPQGAAANGLGGWLLAAADGAGMVPLRLAQAAVAPGPAGPAAGIGPARRALAPAGLTELEADRLKVLIDQQAEAEGSVVLRGRGLVIRADRLRYDTRTETARASGGVSIERDGARYFGRELELQVERSQGYFLEPQFDFPALGSGGRAARVDFIDRQRSVASDAVYTSCPREPDTQPDWVLKADRVQLDLAANEGIAQGAVLRFLGVPILGFPVLSFPLTDDRKSGWLPPTILPVDSRNGFTVGVPYYWNIAPNRDATLTPIVMTRRGLGLEAEFRYLEPGHAGRLNLHGLPHDRSIGQSRFALEADLSGRLSPAGLGLDYGLRARRASDDAYWKDFPHVVETTSPRLLSKAAWLEHARDLRWGRLAAYARVQHWQVLQSDVVADRIVSPYQRSPQLGLQLQSAEGQRPGGLRYALQTEVNRFTRPDGTASAVLPTGWRWHAVGSLSYPWARDGLWLTPRLTLNAAAYDVDQVGALRQHGARLIPTSSIDGGMVFERSVRWFGREQQQTLEPRVLWVNTPFRRQDDLPNFDAAERDFNSVSIFAENAFAGIDRVADAHQVTAGVTSRLIDATTGAETLRLALAQRVRLREQRVVLQGAPQTQRFSEVLVEASTSVFRPWRLDAALQYNPDSQRVVRSIVGARYSPGPFRTVSAGYRLARGLSEQFELGWQWPVYRGEARPVGAASGCGGVLYAVGRLNYSMKDSRITDSLLGVEYDSGCWVARVLAERLSTGRAEATTRMLVQLELVGLSRLGANPLQALKDNIPGYRLLREPRGSIPVVEP